jgi:5-methylcytosine-specific restriction endonuclease McrA
MDVRFRSKKRQAVYANERRPVVVRLMDEFPICVRCGTNPSDDVHEIVSRARGGSITDPANLVCLCRRCHSWVTTHPREATMEGWSAASWDRDKYTTPDDAA